MKKSYKALLISLSVAVAAFLCLNFFAVRNGSFKLSNNKNNIEYYYFNAVKAHNTFIYKDKTYYKVKSGKVIRKANKKSFKVKAKDKKYYYVKNGKTYSGLLDDKLYKHGRIDTSATGLKDVDGKQLCFSSGRLYTGIYEKIYYTNGVHDITKNGRCVIDGKEYYFDNGVLCNGLYNNEYLKDGVIDTSKDGFVTIDSVEYLFDKGVLFNGVKDKKYYNNGLFDKTKTGNVQSGKKTYYVENGLVYTGFKNNAMYKNGLPNKKYNGFIIIDGIEYYFDKGLVVSAPDSVPVKILLVGNSYTYYNGMGQMLCKFIKATGKSALVVRVTKGGWSLRSLMSKTPAYVAWLDGKRIAAGDKKLKEVTETDFADLNRKGKWDYIVCQNNDSLSKTESGDITFFNEYRKNVNSDEKILYNAVYYGSSTSKNRYKIITSVSKKTGATVINTLAYYSAYNSYFSRDWTKDLTVGDNPHHPSSKGAYLMALCIYTKIYGNKRLADSNTSDNYIGIYNSDGKFSNQFAPNKFKRKKKTTDYSMSITKSDAKKLQYFVSKYTDSYLGEPLVKEDNKNDSDKKSENG